MTKEKLQIGDILESDSNQIAFVNKILPTKVRVYINNQKDYILDNQLSHWKYANPIKDNRIVSSKTFAIRFNQFLEWIPKSWWMSMPHYYEEYEYMLNVSRRLLNYQIQTAKDEEEINYLKRLNLYE